MWSQISNFDDNRLYFTLARDSIINLEDKSMVYFKVGNKVNLWKISLSQKHKKIWLLWLKQIQLQTIDMQVLKIKGKII